MRPTDWSALGLTGDPTPGDPVVIRGGAQKMRTVADMINRCAANLRALEVGSSQSESVKALMESKKVIVDGALAAEGRYRATGEALESYALVLDGVQSDTYDALVAARAAKADAARAA
ncbi:hypothetical protein [Buchananella hordeovulneris]|nr:hypothetical protein [Buchananella hordeovulneris]MDO5080150.1 hypothetical protein [Buchananella hordeovulneris]